MISWTSIPIAREREKRSILFLPQFTQLDIYVLLIVKGGMDIGVSN